MQTRRPPLPTLPIPRRRSSLLSLNSAASPHTPRSSGCFDACPPPVCYAAHRKSTDSWNSSNADDMEFDWKPDQILLLTRTLDALPAHLVTPFNGPIPPSNLLDKIARGVAHAKGPVDWPHSIRATRIKLLELARSRAKEDAVVESRRRTIQEEDAVEIADGSASACSDPHNAPDQPVRRRPLYRQSSMDFIKPGAAPLKDNPNIARLSNRFQRNDRVLANPSFHPYARASRGSNRVPDENRRSESPPHSSDVPTLLSPSTPSSTTLNSSLSSLSSAPISLNMGLAMGLRPRALRRSASTLSSSSMFSSSAGSTGGGVAHDPRLQRVRRADSFASGVPPPPPPKDGVGIKRAPSYGALAQDAKAKGHVRQLSTGTCASSDEEEKVRTRRAKKMRTRVVETPGGVQSPPSSVPPSPSVAGSPIASPRPARKVESVGTPRAVKAKPERQREREKEKDEPTPPQRATKPREENKGALRDTVTTSGDKAARASPSRVPAPVRAPRMSAQRNPSMFGAELPPVPVPATTTPPARVRATLATRAPVLAAAVAAAAASSTIDANANARVTPASPVRRIIRAPLGALSTSTGNTNAGQGLGSALGIAPSPTLTATPPLSPDGSASPRVKTLRRVRRLPGARRISFGSLAEEENAGSAVGNAGGLEEGFVSRRTRDARERGLGSAFQMN